MSVHRQWESLQRERGKTSSVCCMRTTKTISDCSLTTSSQNNYQRGQVKTKLPLKRRLFLIRQQYRRSDSINLKKQCSLELKELQGRLCGFASSLLFRQSKMILPIDNRDLFGDRSSSSVRISNPGSLFSSKKFEETPMGVSLIFNFTNFHLGLSLVVGRVHNPWERTLGP